MKKMVETRRAATTKVARTANTMKAARRARRENTAIRNSTRRDQRQPDTTKRPTRMNIIKNTSSTMTSTKKANIR